MRLPDDIATMRGAELLTAFSRFFDDFSTFYGSQAEGQIAGQWAQAFRGVADALQASRTQGELHVRRMAEKRAKGERVFRETDETVDLIIAALRSPFIRPDKEASPS